MRWYVNQNGKTVGPFPEERIAMLATWGKISRDAYICDEQFSTWVAIKRSAFASLIDGGDDGEAGAGESPAEVAERSSQHVRAWLTGAVLLAGVLVLAISST